MPFANDDIEHHRSIWVVHGCADILVIFRGWASTENGSRLRSVISNGTSRSLAAVVGGMNGITLGGRWRCFLFVYFLYRNEHLGLMRRLHPLRISQKDSQDILCICRFDSKIEKKELSHRRLLSDIGKLAKHAVVCWPNTYKPHPRLASSHRSDNIVVVASPAEPLCERLLRKITSVPFDHWAVVLSLQRI